MRFLCLILLLSLTPAGAFAVDLFGSEQLDEGEISISEQKELFKHFFGKMDEDATSSSKRLKFAIQLQQSYSDEKFAALRRYILRRIEELVRESRKKEAIDLQVFVFNERYKKKERNYRDNATLIALLEKQLKKAPRGDRESLASEIVALLNENAQFSLKEKNYERALDDLEELASWLGKMGDKEGAQTAKDLSESIEDYQDEKQEVQELVEELKQGGSNVKANARVGRFYVLEEEWAKALPYLQMGQEELLSNIARTAQNADPSAEEMVACVVSIGRAIKERSMKDQNAMKRRLLKLGVVYRSVLRDMGDDLPTSLQVKYDMISATFEDQLAALGPDLLNPASLAASGGSVDESRMLRNGWVMLFDHKTNTLTAPGFKNTEAASVTVERGMLVIRGKSGNSVSLRNIPEQEKYKGIHIRFKFVTKASAKFMIKVPGMNGQIVWVDVLDSWAGFTTGYTHIHQPAFGKLPINENDWNDLRMIWDGKTAEASINGVAFEKAPSRPSPDTDIIYFKVGSSDSDFEVHVQSFMALKR